MYRCIEHCSQYLEHPHPHGQYLHCEGLIIIVNNIDERVATEGVIDNNYKTPNILTV